MAARPASARDSRRKTRLNVLAPVFDRTEGDAVDLYRVPLAGGEPRQLTSAPAWEWRANPGRRTWLFAATTPVSTRHRCLASSCAT